MSPTKGSDWRADNMPSLVALIGDRVLSGITFSLSYAGVAPSLISDATRIIVDVTPAPVLSRLERFDDRMTSCMKVRCCVLVPLNHRNNQHARTCRQSRRCTQSSPVLQTLFAAIAAWSDCSNLIKMRTSLYHDILSANDELTLLLPTTAQRFVELDKLTRARYVSFAPNSVQHRIARCQLHRH